MISPQSPDVGDSSRGPPLELPAVPRQQLLDLSAWREGLQRYALAANLAVALTDAEGRQLGECINPQPTWRLFHAAKHADAGSCPFSLMPPRPCTCVADALNGGGFRLARDGVDLVHFAVPLLLGGERLGALVAGQVFDHYPDQLALEHAARRHGLQPQTVWQSARLEHPLKQATLHVYADLLATLANSFLHSRHHALTEAGRLDQMMRLSDQLRQRTRELVEADQHKDEFLAMLAHELRNPLAPLRNAAQIMRPLVQNDANLRWIGEMVERQVQHLSRLVDDLLDVSRFSSGKITLQKQPTDLTAVAACAAESARLLAEGRRQQLSMALPVERLWVEADPVRMTQVVGNLLNNAIKYTPEGGHIWLNVRGENGDAVLSVRDTGIGIPAAMLSSVFELFIQVEPALDRSHGGLGIGLTLVRKLIELHGGRVEAHSAGANQGSEFIIHLPLSAEMPRRQEAAEEKNEAATPALSRRVLVVDDNADAADSLAKILELSGHEVQIARDGPTALETAQRYRPEVVILDIGLPGMDGYAVARRLREQPAMNNTLLVALTGYGQAEDRRRSGEAGFHKHLVKPIDPRQIQDLLAVSH